MHYLVVKLCDHRSHNQKLGRKFIISHNIESCNINIHSSHTFVECIIHLTRD